MTLVNHGLIGWTIGLILLIVFVILEKVSLKNKSLKESYFLLFLLIISILRFQIFVINEVDAIFVNAFFGNTYRYVLCIGIWFIIRNISLDVKSYYLTDLLAPILKLHVSIFFIQFIVYFASGNYIDLLKLTTGIESRYLGFDSSLVGIGSFRPTGLFSEPSNYSMVVLALSSLLIINNRYTKHKGLILVSIISMFLSFSTAAVFAALLLVIYIFIEQKLYKKTLYIIPLLLLIAISSTTIYTLSQIQVDRLDSRAGNLRMDLVKAVLDRELDDALLSYGAYGMETELYMKVSNQSSAGRVSSSNDAGLLIYMWLRFGYMGVLSFIIISIIMYNVSRGNLFLFLILSLTKISLFYPIFILYIAVSLSSKKLYSLRKHKYLFINTKV